ncbi:MDR family oxidoreductase [Vibrio zhugei]|uniref:MDR family oxidoreductase n=1 Tax=Vibrio zhugei TaxID=2479546 RepID=A0ABV7CAB7_9VIBR|nr:MDR family oxidoreductase [Vibrio zhugei]
MFNALYIDKVDDQYQCTMTSLNDTELAEGDVTVKVTYSSLNYKDGLAITGRSPVVRRFPMIPGIDFAGVVESSQHPSFNPGQRVFINGWGLGEKHWGGLTEKATVKGDWLLPIPDALSDYDVMAVGTAGYTAMLCVQAVQNHGITPESGKILVTGANGGVGSFAISYLSKLGYTVVASTGRAEETPRLKALGADEIIDRASLSEPGRALGKEQWAAAIDSVGSHTLANVCASIQYGGIVAACGLAQGMDFPSSVAPFILRGVTLAGIDSVMCPNEKRLQAWAQIAKLIDEEMIQSISTCVSFSEAMESAERLLKGEIKGRVVVDIQHA